MPVSGVESTVMLTLLLLFGEEGTVMLALMPVSRVESTVMLTHMSVFG